MEFAGGWNILRGGEEGNVVGGVSAWLGEDVEYIRYIFAVLTVIIAGFLCAVAYGHVGFARLPDCLLK